MYSKQLYRINSNLSASLIGGWKDRQTFCGISSVDRGGYSRYLHESSGPIEGKANAWPLHCCQYWLHIFELLMLVIWALEWACLVKQLKMSAGGKNDESSVWEEDAWGSAMIKYMVKITHVSLYATFRRLHKGHTSYMDIILNVIPTHAFLSRANGGR